MTLPVPSLCSSGAMCPVTGFSLEISSLPEILTRGSVRGLGVQSTPAVTEPFGEALWGLWVRNGGRRVEWRKTDEGA